MKNTDHVTILDALKDHEISEIYHRAQLELNPKKVDYQAYVNAVKETHPLLRKVRNNQLWKKEPKVILEGLKETFHPVRSNERLSKSYRFVEDVDENDAEIFQDFGEEGAEIEYRHPGTSYDSDGEYLCNDERFQPCNTKMGQCLHAIAFAAPRVGHCELRSAYPMQIVIRIDDARLALNYDCYEYKPPSSSDSQKLPLVRSLFRYEERFNFGRKINVGDKNDNEVNLDTVIKPKNGESFNEEDKRKLFIMGLTGDFFDSRVFRFRVNLETIVGARLQVMGDIPGAQNNADYPAVLILDFSCPPQNDFNGTNVPAFCARRVCPKFISDGNWNKIDDFTPNRVASKATRHYIFGNFVELKELTAHLCAISSRFAKLVAKENIYYNSLRLGNVDLSYNGAPLPKRMNRISDIKIPLVVLFNILMSCLKDMLGIVMDHSYEQYTAYNAYDVMSTHSKNKASYFHESITSEENLIPSSFWDGIIEDDEYVPYSMMDIFREIMERGAT